jgi:protoporphyrinogen oxidase
MRVVIVGGGIAGLFTAIMCKTRLPNAKITIIEKNSRLGGRVFTKKYIDGSSFESGAGRFGMKHKILMALLRDIILIVILFQLVIKSSQNWDLY